MIAIDTNILLRYLVEDEATQAGLAIKLIEHDLSAERPGFISLTVLVEVAWALKGSYGQTSADIRGIIGQLLESPQIVFEQAAVVDRALALEIPDLADAIIHESGRAHGCEKTVTFDRRFARVPGVALLSA